LWATPNNHPAIRFLLPHGIGLLHQDEEDRLEGVLHVLRRRQHTPAHRPDHLSMAVHQPFEGSFILGRHEAL